MMDAPKQPRAESSLDVPEIQRSTPADADPRLKRNGGNGQTEDATTTSLAAATNALGSAVVQEFDAIRQALREIHGRLNALSSSGSAPLSGETGQSDLFERYRALSERFHEREVLQPVFLALIGIVDRCRDQETQLQQTLDRLIARDPNNKPAIKALRDRQALRAADRMDIDNVLGVFGVDPFQNPAPEFDPQVQSSIRRVLCRNGQVPGRLAQRLRVGYRREAWIIRREYVTVFVRETNEGE